MHPTLPSPRRFQRSSMGLGHWEFHPQEISLGSFLGHLDGIHFLLIFISNDMSRDYNLSMACVKFYDDIIIQLSGFKYLINISGNNTKIAVIK